MCSTAVVLSLRVRNVTLLALKNETKQNTRVFLRSPGCSDSCCPTSALSVLRLHYRKTFPSES